MLILFKGGPLDGEEQNRKGVGTGDYLTGLVNEPGRIWVYRYRVGGMVSTDDPGPVPRIATFEGEAPEC